MDKDRIEGSAKQFTGAVKEAVVKVVGDAKLQAERAPGNIPDQDHMARVIRISASGHCAWRGRPASARATADLDLMPKIRTIHAISREAYGAPPTHAELKAEEVTPKYVPEKLIQISADRSISR